MAVEPQDIVVVREIAGGDGVSLIGETDDLVGVMAVLEFPGDGVGAIEADAEELDLLVGDQPVGGSVQQQGRRGHVVEIIQSLAGENGAGEGNHARIAEPFRQILLRQGGAVAALEVALE